MKYVHIERIVVLFVLTRIALLAAVISNVEKAAWAFGEVSESGAWSPLPLAFALELMLGVVAYAAWDALAQGKNPRPFLAVTAVFAVISASANIAYFYANGGNWLTAGLWGIAAPGIALACGIVSGAAVGQAASEQREADGRAYQVRIAELAAVAAQASASEARAEARRAKLESVRVEPQLSGNLSQPLPEPVHDWQAFLATYPNMLEMTGKQIAELAGVSERTGNNWKRYAGNDNGNHNGAHQ